MTRRIIGIVLTLLGAATIVAGYLSTTIWRTSDTVVATSPSAEVPFVVVEPGVAGIVNNRVEIAVTAADPEQVVTVITARDVDVDAWLGDAAQQRITDVVEWDSMVTEDVEGTLEGFTAQDPVLTASDLWLEVQQAPGEVTFDWDVPTGRQTLLIARDGAEGPAPTVSFTWEREVTTPYFVPLMAAGIPAVILGLALVVWSIVDRKGRKKNGENGETGAGAATAADEGSSVVAGDAATPTSAATTEGSAPDSAELGAAVTDPGPSTAETVVLTRRQRRELADTGALAAAATAAPAPQGEEGTEVDVERIASEITPVDDVAQAPDAPDAYPSWLRSDEAVATPDGESEHVPDGPTLDGQALDEQTVEEARAAWRRRWGVEETPSAQEADLPESDEPATPEADAWPAADAEPEAETGAETEADAEPEPEPDAEADAEPEPAADAEPVVDLEPTAEPASEDEGPASDEPDTSTNEEDQR